jgi:hypothetical protein
MEEDEPTGFVKYEKFEPVVVKAYPNPNPPTACTPHLPQPAGEGGYRRLPCPTPSLLLQRPGQSPRCAPPNPPPTATDPPATLVDRASASPVLGGDRG